MVQTNLGVDLSAQEPRPTRSAQGSNNCSTRRDALKYGLCVCVGVEGLRPASAYATAAADLRPMPGDRLTLADADGPPRPLRIADVPKYSKPLQAFPFDATNRLARDGSRFNKVLLLRLDPETMDEQTRKRSIDGVVAFSSICTHQGCDVTEWLAADKDLMCFCHFSKFDPAHGAQVVAGPAPRSLPALPLTSVDGELVVRGTFTTTPGPTTTN